MSCEDFNVSHTLQRSTPSAGRKMTMFCFSDSSSLESTRTKFNETKSRTISLSGSLLTLESIMMLIKIGVTRISFQQTMGTIQEPNRRIKMRKDREGVVASLSFSPTTKSRLSSFLQNTLSATLSAALAECPVTSSLRDPWWNGAWSEVSPQHARSSSTSLRPCAKTRQKKTERWSHA